MYEMYVNLFYCQTFLNSSALLRSLVTLKIAPVDQKSFWPRFVCRQTFKEFTLSVRNLPFQRALLRFLKQCQCPTVAEACRSNYFSALFPNYNRPNHTICKNYNGPFSNLQSLHN